MMSPSPQNLVIYHQGLGWVLVKFCSLNKAQKVFKIWIPSCVSFPNLAQREVLEFLLFTLCSWFPFCGCLCSNHVSERDEALYSSPAGSAPFLPYNQQVSHFSSVQSLSRVRLFVTPWTAACPASLSITNAPGAFSNSCPSSW